MPSLWLNLPPIEDRYQELEWTMPEINPFFTELVRQDSLTNCGNHVSFFDWLVEQGKKETFKPFTLLSTEVRGLRTLNQKSGRDAGDTALRWAANILTQRTGQPCFRMGNEFISILFEGSLQTHAVLAKEIYTQLNKTASTVELDAPVANVTGIAFSERSNQIQA